jgi:hypothetical protein
MMKEMTLRTATGREIKATIEWVSEMRDKIVDADGDKINVGKEIVEYGHINLGVAGHTAHPWKYQIEDEAEERTISGYTGMAIRSDGLLILMDTEDWKALCEAIDTICVSSDEVEEYRINQNKEQAKAEYDRAVNTVARAERQADIPTKEEAKARIRSYNNVANEGGEGWVPTIIDIDWYNYCKDIIRKYEQYAR